VALKRGYPFTEPTDGKDKAKMAVGGGSDVQLADATGAAGLERNGVNGAGGPARRARSVVRGDSGSRRVGALQNNGCAMRGGNAHAGYSDEAEDQEAEHSLLVGAGPSPIRRLYFIPPSLGTRDAVPVMSDDASLEAATNTRRVALFDI